MNKTAAETRGSLNSRSITRSKSTGSFDNGDNSTRNSSAKTDSANVNQRKIPIYLRAPTGSCHDICKYGRGHAFEDKPKIPLRKRIAKPSFNEDAFIEILVPSEQKKEKVDSKKNSQKPSSDSHSQRPNDLSSGKTRSPKPPEFKKTLPQDSIDDDKMSRTDHRTFAQVVKHPSSVKSKPLVRVKSLDGVHGMGRKDGDVQTGGKVRASLSVNKSATVPLVPKSSPSKTASNKARQSGRVKSSFPGKDQRRIETEVSNGQVSEKTLHVIKIEMGNSPLLESAPENVSLSQENPSTVDEVNETDEFASENKTITMEIERNIFESILDSHVTPPFPSRPSSKSSSHHRSSSPSSKFSSHRRSPSSSEFSSHGRSPSSSEFSSHGRSPSSSEFSSHRRSPSSSEFSSHRRSPSSSEFSSHRRSPSSSKFSSHRRYPSSSSSSSSKSSSHRRSPSSSSSKLSSHSRSPSMSFIEEEIKEIVKETNKLSSVKKTTPNDNSKAALAKGNLNKNQRMTRVISSDDKHNRPVKLKFRSGKVMDLRQDTNTNNIPRRLTFRRMRLDGNKAETSVFHSNKSPEISSIQPYSKFLRKGSRVVVSEYKRRSPMRFFGSGAQADNNMPFGLRFRRGQIIGADELKGYSKRNIRNCGVQDAANLNIKLKHQDLKGKDAQCLFNNVIEETATKLVESRKSKVKALVGAFETVIFLQEHKPSLRT